MLLINNLQEPEYIFLSSMLNPSHEIFTIQSNFDEDREITKRMVYRNKEL